MEQVALEQSCNGGRPRAATQSMGRVRLLDNVWTLRKAPVWLACLWWVDMGRITGKAALSLGVDLEKQGWRAWHHTWLLCRSSYPTTYFDSEVNVGYA